jgi:hypothetical protein
MGLVYASFRYKLCCEGLIRTVLCQDMFEKMVQIDPNAPSDAEQRAQAVTKPR